eukprot:gene10933-3639_t
MLNAKNRTIFYNVQLGKNDFMDLDDLRTLSEYKMLKSPREESDYQLKYYFTFEPNSLKGLKIVEVECFEDTFLDTDSHDLILKGFWLKKRFDAHKSFLDLKYSMVDTNDEELLRTEQFRTENDIKSILKDELRIKDITKLSVYTKMGVKRLKIYLDDASKTLYLESFTFDKKKHYLLGTLVMKKNCFKFKDELAEYKVKMPVRSKIVEFIYQKDQVLYKKLSSNNFIFKHRKDNLEYYDEDIEKMMNMMNLVTCVIGFPKEINWDDNVGNYEEKEEEVDAVQGFPKEINWDDNVDNYEEEEEVDAVQGFPKEINWE